MDCALYANREPRGDSYADGAATRIDQRWQEVVPERITVESEEEFDSILDAFLSDRESYGYDLVVEYEQELLDARKALFD